MCKSALPLLCCCGTVHVLCRVTSCRAMSRCVMLNTPTHTHTPLHTQVIEKAYKKLRLDALVIQQGRLTENQGAKVGGRAGVDTAIWPREGVA